jgi:steroid delta-isomerase-like uncharacterized protein
MIPIIYVRPSCPTRCDIQPELAPMSTAELNSADHIRQLVNRWYEEVWTKRRDATIDEMMAPECRVNVEGESRQLNKDEYKAYRRAFLSAVPDLRVDMSIIAIEGTTAITSFRATGTHTGGGLGIPPSNGPVDFSGLTRFHFKDGLIVGGADSWNRGEFIASLMQVRMDQICTAAGLTLRESQVALMMAERFTHLEIAEQLKISPNTARRHCEHVLRKLGLSSRHDVGAALGRIAGARIPGHAEDLKPA